MDWCVWEQCAWKFSRLCKDPISSDSHEIALSYSDCEKVVQYNYSLEERKVMIELVSYIKGIELLLQKADTLVDDALWETIHVKVQDFVQYTLAMMLRTTFRKKKDLSRILSDMHTLSAYWMANTSKPESDMQTFHHGGEESRVSFFYPRPVAPTFAQIPAISLMNRIHRSQMRYLLRSCESFGALMCNAVTSSIFGKGNVLEVYVAVSMVDLSSGSC